MPYVKILRNREVPKRVFGESGGCPAPPGTPGCDAPAPTPLPFFVKNIAVAMIANIEEALIPSILETRCLHN